MKLQYITTIAAASLLSASLVGLLPSNASASSVRGSSITVPKANACAGNPCAGSQNPCAGSQNPCAGSQNPCAGNPCAGS